MTSGIWLRATSKHIGLPLSALIPALRQSALVATLAGVGPVMALWLYGPYPEHFAMPLVLGGGVGLVGFVAGVMWVQHPLEDELMSVLSKIRRAIA
jgi:hypothetical protein